MTPEASQVCIMARSLILKQVILELARKSEAMDKMIAAQIIQPQHLKKPWKGNQTTASLTKKPTHNVTNNSIETPEENTRCNEVQSQNYPLGENTMYRKRSYPANKMPPENKNDISTMNQPEDTHSKDMNYAKKYAMPEKKHTRKKEAEKVKEGILSS